MAATRLATTLLLAAKIERASADAPDMSSPWTYALMGGTGLVALCLLFDCWYERRQERLRREAQVNQGSRFFNVPSTPPEVRVERVQSINDSGNSYVPVAGGPG